MYSPEVIVDSWIDRAEYVDRLLVFEFPYYLELIVLQVVKG